MGDSDTTYGDDEQESKSEGGITPSWYEQADENPATTQQIEQEKEENSERQA